MLILETPQAAIVKVAFTCDGQTLMFLPRGGYGIGEVSFATGTLDLRWPQHRCKPRKHVQDFAVSPIRPELVAFVRGGGRIDILNRESAAIAPLERVVGLRFGPIPQLSFSPDGQWLACSRVTRRTENYTRSSASLPAILWNMQGAENPDVGYLFPRGLAFTPTADRIAINASRSREVQLWSIHDQTQIGTLHHGHKHLQVAFSPEGNLLAAGHPGGYVRVWDVATHALHSRIQHRFDNRGVVRIETGRSYRRILTGIERVMTSMHFSPDGEHLVTTATDGQVRLWNVDSGELVRVYDWEVGALYSLAFAPDGLRAAVGGDRGIVVWDWE